MVALSYHIRPSRTEAFESDSRGLLIEAGSGKLGILLWDKTRAMPEGAEVFTGITDWENQWAEMVQQSELMGYRSLETIVLLNTPRFLTIPSIFYRPLEAAGQLEALFGEAAYLHTAGDIVPEQDMVVAWQVSKDIQECINGHFEVVQFRSMASLLVQNGPAAEKSSFAGYLLVSGQLVWLGAWRDGQLLIIKSIPAHEAENVAYQMLNICRQWGIAPEKMNWKVAGIISPDSPLWQATERFFNHFSPDDGGVGFGSEVPAHFFAHQTGYLKRATQS